MIPIDIALWDASQIAEYLRLAPRTVAEKVTVQPTFPRPLHIGTGAKHKARRWKAVDVIEWANAQAG